ncbi:MAG: RrF2 family transcriptional regulator [Alphaproteobacteria bacterium]
MQFIQNKLYLAMNAAMFIAYNGSEEQPVPGSAIVDYSNMNKRALEPVLQRLSSAGLVVSIKGARGGYYMSRPEHTTLRDIAEAFIDRVVPEKHEFEGYDSILDEKLENFYDGWLDSLSDITFSRLCVKARNSGKISKFSAPVLNFSI